jgi:hypothetical protein
MNRLHLIASTTNPSSGSTITATKRRQPLANHHMDEPIILTNAGTFTKVHVPDFDQN